LGAATAIILVVISGGLTYGAFFALQGVFGGMMPSHAPDQNLDTLRWIYAVAPMVGLSVAALLGWRLAFVEENLIEATGLRAVSVGICTVAMITGACLQFPLSEIGNWVHEFSPMSVDEQIRLRELLEPDDALGGLGALLGLAVVPAFFEELLFRGVLLPGLARRYGNASAVILSSVLFGVLHLTSAAVIYATLGGLLFAYLRLRTGSLWVPIAAHFGVNGVPLVLSNEILSIPGFNVVSESVLHLPWWLVGVTSLMTAGGVFILGRVRVPGGADDRER